MQFRRSFKVSVGLALWSGAVSEHEWSQLVKIREGEELLGLKGRTIVHVGLQGPLSPNSSFEVRVSYLATTPAAFFFQVVDCADLPSTSNHASEPEEKQWLRRILNTERFRVQSDENGDIVLNNQRKSNHAVLVISVQQTGVRPPGTKKVSFLEDDAIRFNLALDRVILGAIPQSSTRMIFWGLFTLLFALICLAPRLSKLASGQFLRGRKCGDSK